MTWYWELRGGLRTLQIKYTSLTMRIGKILIMMMISIILNIIVIVIITNPDQSTYGGEVGVVEFVMIPAAGGGAA